MGSGIAQVAATAGNNVILYDANKEAQEGAEALIVKMLAKLEEKGKLQESAASICERISYAHDIDEFKSCELIIEAIVENLQIKKNVFEEVESIVSNSCILASNTSSLSIASIAAACKNPGRVIGIHFFNPA
ncbi:MAG: 3-hydroxybutyryl-CoA dehydrogenase, partial [Flavobacteriales bacterium]